MGRRAELTRSRSAGRGRDRRVHRLGGIPPSSLKGVFSTLSGQLDTVFVWGLKVAFVTGRVVVVGTAVLIVGGCLVDPRDS